jgi:phage terminase large subunit GpA-like protein
MENNGDVYLVRVKTDDRKHRIYAVACARKDALNEVLKVVPEGWSASLLTEQLPARDIAALNLRPGEVKEITQ